MVNQTKIVSLQQLKMMARDFAGFGVVELTSSGSMILAKLKDGTIESYFVQDLISSTV